jgi:hypothetical protein
MSIFDKEITITFMPFVYELTQGCEERIHESGFSMITTTYEHEGEKKKEYVIEMIFKGKNFYIQLHELHLGSDFYLSFKEVFDILKEMFTNPTEEIRKQFLTERMGSFNIGRCVINRETAEKEQWVELADKFPNWYYITIDNCPENVFREKQLAEELKKHNIFWRYYYGDSSTLRIFEKFTKEELFYTFKINDFLHKTDDVMKEVKQRAIDNYIEEFNPLENFPKEA